MFIGSIVVILMLNLGFQLIVLAQDASSTTVSFATQMTEQLKCTHNGIPLAECDVSHLQSQLSTHAELQAQLNQTQLLAHNITQTYAQLYGIE